MFVDLFPEFDASCAYPWFAFLKSFLYQALAVIEYLVAHGSERAIDDIIEHTFQISVRTIFLDPAKLPTIFSIT